MGVRWAGTAWPAIGVTILWLLCLLVCLGCLCFLGYLGSLLAC